MVVLTAVLPAVLGLVALALKRTGLQLGILLTGAILHAGLTGWLWLEPRQRLAGTYLGLDGPGLLFLGITSLLFLIVSIYSIAYFESADHHEVTGRHLWVPLLLWFLSAMSLVTISQHLALMWVAVEATTLVSAPLICYYRRGAALEAAWKYLVICSVGIALALLGTFFLAMAARGVEGPNPVLSLPALLSQGEQLVSVWLQLAFVLALVGYGTKMGLVPLHTWLPDAHSQAPSPVSALLSGALLNCAFLGILRFYQICVAGGVSLFAQRLLLSLGFASLVVAVTFIIGQRDYKRLLAYSSVENMGILAIGVGLGGSAAYGAMLHAVNHSLAKAALFMLFGNVLKVFGTSEISGVRGLLRSMPRTGVALVAALLAIGGSPPFGPFISEFTVFRGAVAGGQMVLAVLFVSVVAVAFIGLVGSGLRMAQGEGGGRTRREPAWQVVPPALLVGMVLVLGLYVPPVLDQLLSQAVASFGGR